MKVCIISYDEYINIPYIQKYEYYLKKHNISYDIILWDRRDVIKDNVEGTYLFKSPVRKSKLSKIIPFLKWRKFVLQILESNVYDKLIILTTIPGILIYKKLLNQYEEKYIFDIRDYTYEYLKIYKKMVNKLVQKSSITFISSEGFKSWLQPNEKICITHNITNIDKNLHDINLLKNREVITIGFVGGIRYYDENKKLIENLQNRRDIQMVYAGKVHAGIKLKEYCVKNNVVNVTFEPEFTNDQKPEIYKNIDVINAVYGDNNMVVKTALPNKLYDCILFKKPIMASENTYLAEIVKKYHLGFAIDIEKDDIYNKLYEFISKFNLQLFLEGCDELIQKVIQEEKNVTLKIEDFIGDYHNAIN